MSRPKFGLLLVLALCLSGCHLPASPDAIPVLMELPAAAVGLVLEYRVAPDTGPISVTAMRRAEHLVRNRLAHMGIEGGNVWADAKGTLVVGLPTHRRDAADRLTRLLSVHGSVGLFIVAPPAHQQQQMLSPMQRPQPEAGAKVDRLIPSSIRRVLVGAEGTPNAGKKIVVENHPNFHVRPLVVDDAFRHVDRDGSVGVNFTTARHQRSRVRQMTRNARGRQVALVVGDEIRAIVDVGDEPQSGGRIEGPFQESDIQNLLDVLTIGGLPGRFDLIKESERSPGGTPANIAPRAQAGATSEVH